MTQETTKDKAAEATKELDPSKADAVGGGSLECNPAGWTGELIQAYENLIDATSYVIERLANTTR